MHEDTTAPPVSRTQRGVDLVTKVEMRPPGPVSFEDRGCQVLKTNSFVYHLMT